MVEYVDWIRDEIDFYDSLWWNFRKTRFIDTALCFFSPLLTKLTKCFIILVMKRDCLRAAFNVHNITIFMKAHSTFPFEIAILNSCSVECLRDCSQKNCGKKLISNFKPF
jgi:hypothetical protein